MSGGGGTTGTRTPQTPFTPSPRPIGSIGGSTQEGRAHGQAPGPHALAVRPCRNPLPTAVLLGVVLRGGGPATPGRGRGSGEVADRVDGCRPRPRAYPESRGSCRLQGAGGTRDRAPARHCARGRGVRCHPAFGA